MYVVYLSLKISSAVKTLGLSSSLSLVLWDRLLIVAEIPTSLFFNSYNEEFLFKISYTDL